MKKRAAKKHARRVRPASPPHEAVIVLRRFVVITGCLGLFIFIFAICNKATFNRAVAGMSITRGLFVQSTVPVPNIPGAASYNIYYKTASETDYTNAVRNIPSYLSFYTISYLKKGVVYQYKIAAVNHDGGEYWFAPEKILTNLQSM